MAKLRGLDKIYYNMNVDSLCMKENDFNMLLKLRSEHWSYTLQMFNEPKLAEKAS